MGFSTDGDTLLKYEGDVAAVTVPDGIKVIGPRVLSRILLAFISYFPVVQAIYEKNDSHLYLFIGVLGGYLDRLLALAIDDNKPELVAALLEEKNGLGQDKRGWKEFSLAP